MSGHVVFFSLFSPSCDSAQAYEYNESAVFLISATWEVDHVNANQLKYGGDQSSAIQVKYHGVMRVLIHVWSL